MCVIVKARIGWLEGSSLGQLGPGRYKMGSRVAR